jgi:hypothetical protein
MAPTVVTNEERHRLDILESRGVEVEEVETSRTAAISSGPASGSEEIRQLRDFGLSLMACPPIGSAAPALSSIGRRNRSQATARNQDGVAS